MTRQMIRNILAIGLFIVIGTLAGCASCDRGIKSCQSDISGGLERTVTLYDYNGDVIDEWSGKLDVSESENEVFFDLNNERTIIHGGIVVIQEGLND